MSMSFPRRTHRPWAAISPGTSTASERVQAATIGGIAFFAVEARVGRMGICSRPGTGMTRYEMTKHRDPPIRAPWPDYAQLVSPKKGASHG
ncbi:hypothetical protein GCM10023346_03300 [Arthrobacter gyeryongensis]|uniref:Uncharacterized protein n=1 Tax=Arthrobacter gyeryongensis TaxID=1650592 RepID=A0ABP9RZR8_9MICC